MARNTPKSEPKAVRFVVLLTAKQSRGVERLSLRREDRSKGAVVRDAIDRVLSADVTAGAA